MNSIKNEATKASTAFMVGSPRDVGRFLDFSAPRAPRRAPCADRRGLPVSGELSDRRLLSPVSRGRSSGATPEVMVLWRDDARRCVIDELLVLRAAACARPHQD